MKKSLILALVAVFATCAARASMVTSEEARAVAVAWSERNAAFGVSAADVGTPKQFADTNGVTLWYWVQMGTSCLIVAPVTEIEPVIASLENVDATKGLPSGHPMLAMLTRDMTDRLKKLGLYQPQAPSGGATLQSAAPKSGATPEDPEFAAAWAKEGEARWARLLPKGGARLMATPKEEGVTEIAIQIGIVDGFEKDGRFTHWDQGAGGGGYCYNYYTPDHVVCGCVATSMGAMMQFFAVTGCPSGTNCPSGLIRETQDGFVGATYNGGGAGTYTTLGGDYDWSLFSENQDRASYNALSDAQRELLGRVAYDCGVAVAMQWTSGLDGSGAYVMDVAAALRDVFGFKDARAVRKPTEEQYAKLIYHQCWAGAPVQLGITGDGGHSVLAVGYGTDDGGIPRVRIFTGWGGDGDGWYALPYITTASVPGGGSHNFDVVDGIVTLIGYEDNNVVPVCGRIRQKRGDTVENATVECRGNTVEANEKGYFGLRISASETAGTKPVVANVGGVEKPASVMLGTAPSPKSSTYEYDAADLCSWIPDEILIFLLNAETASTFAEAKERALASIDAGNPKTILAFSGTWGEEATDAAWALLQSYDDGNVDGFTDKYVVLCTPYSLSSDTASDGNPSIAVFDPRSLSVEPDKIWSFYNGRLAYWSIGGAVYTDDAAVAESAATNVVENGSVTTYITGEEITNAVRAVLGTGNGTLLAGVSGITLNVLGYNVADYGGEPGAVEPAYGFHENEISNGTTVVATAPYAATNATTDVEFKCVGWLLTSTNSAEVLSGTGTTARFSPVANGAYTLVWLWEPNAVKITVMVYPEKKIDSGTYGLVSPGTGWFKYGSTVAFTAVPGEPDLTISRYYHFIGWLFGEGDQLQEDKDDYEESSNRLTVTVVRPVTVKARFDKANVSQELPYQPVPPEPPDPLIPPDQPEPPEPPDPSVTNVFDIVWNDGLNNLSSGYTTNLLTTAELQANGWTLNDLTVTAPTGWVASVTQTRNGDVVATLERDDAALSAAMESCALTVYPNDDDTLTVEATIANGLRGFWYVLYGSDDLTTWDAVASGTYESGTPAAQAQDPAKNPVCEVSLSITVTPGDSAAGTKRFYKVVSGATSEPLAE